jgi:DNA-binding beta-propeller fold protein YncE
MRNAIVLTTLAMLLSSCGSRPVEPVVSQTLTGFHRPESCTFSLDGKYLFVSNCASKALPDAFVLVKGAGAISKLAVSPTGEVTMIEPRFVEGIDSPLGISPLPKATGRFPKGTLFVNTDIVLLGDADGTNISDPHELGTGVLILDPETGARLGKIEMGIGSAVARQLGHFSQLPNGLTFDPDGHLYIGDSGITGPLKPPVEGRPGVIRIDHSAIDDLADGQDHPGVAFLPTPTGMNGVGYNRHDDCIWFVSGRNVHKFPRGQMRLDDPLYEDVGGLDGIAFTPAGTVIVSRSEGDLVLLRSGGLPAPMQVEGLPAMKGPSDIKLLDLRDGSAILAVPEQEPDGADWSQRLWILRLPRGY